MEIERVINDGYCVGCGVCPLADDHFSMYRDSFGKNQAKLNGTTNLTTASLVCPFASSGSDEDTISSKLFSTQEGICHDSNIGYYLKNYTGYVKSGDFREKGSSGGMGSWLLSTLLCDGLVDAVIHVKDSLGENMYEYQISYSLEELKNSSKSKYYPIELSSVLKEVRNSKLTFAIVGVPCFIKAVRLLCISDREFESKIKFTIGLVCGHLKSDFFAKAEAWESGIHPDNLQRVDFRYKLANRGANDYGIEAVGNVNGQKQVVVKPTRDLSTTNWGLGYFKYKACDYCDDVVAETADVTIGDAWLPQFVSESKGTNIVIIRNQIIMNLIIKHSEELNLVEEAVGNIVKSQAGGFRHRRDGLKYRLWLNDRNGLNSPKKRISPSNDLTESRKKIYAYRIKLVDESFVAYRIASEKNDFRYFNKHMKPFVRNYRNLNLTLRQRVILQIKKGIRLVVPQKIINKIKN